MTNSQIRIPIYFFQYDQELESDGCDDDNHDPVLEELVHIGALAPRARDLLALVLEDQNLSKEDEIAIISTSEQVYVSTCLTVTAFNFASISRKVSDRTQVVIWVHEYGYVRDGFEEEIAKLRSRGIIVIEDCAHILRLRGSNESYLGKSGDYGLFSLPKILPMDSGGLVIGGGDDLKIKCANKFGKTVVANLKQEAIKQLPKYPLVEKLRIQRYTLLKKMLGNEHEFSEPSARRVPFFLGVKVKNSAEYKRQFPNIEWGGTLHQNVIYIPLNPSVSLSDYKSVGESILDIG